MGIFAVKKSTRVKIFATVLLMGIVAWVVYYAFGVLGGKPETRKAKVTEYRVTEELCAWTFREETVLTAQGEQIVNAPFSNGTKVTAGEGIAEVWDGIPTQMSRKSVQKELDSLNRSISLLESGLQPDETEAGEYRVKLLSDLYRIRMAVREDNWTGIGTLEESVLETLNRYAVLTGKEETISASLQKMKERKEELLVGQKTKFSVPEGDVFYFEKNTVDGYETDFSIDALQNLSVTSFEKLISSAPMQPEGTVAGKYVPNETWYLVAEVANETGKEFSAGKTYSVTLSENGEAQIFMICEKVISENEKTLIVLKTDSWNKDFRPLRKQNIKVTVKTLTGFEIPETAVVKKGTNEGVYVLKDGKIEFRKVEFSHVGKDVRVGKNEKSGLTEGEEIVLFGDSVYEGKKYR